MEEEAEQSSSIIADKANEELTSKEISTTSATVSTPSAEAIIEKNETSTLNSQITPQVTNLKDRILITPLARVLAKQKNIDPRNVVGSGPRGRIVKQDIENFKLLTTTSLSDTNSQNEELYKDVAPSLVRKIIAKRLTESKQNIPHYYVELNCEMDNLVDMRSSINAHNAHNIKISINDFIIKALSLALINSPEVNSSWLEDKIRSYKHADISIAVATDKGLFTPIIRYANKKSLLEISLEMKQLANKAKEGKLLPQDYQGGNFSISNLGMFGIDAFSAIINPPQSGILAVGGTKSVPLVKDQQVKICKIMNITASFDHRVVDGAVAAIFLNVLKNYLENPALMILG